MGCPHFQPAMWYDDCDAVHHQVCAEYGQHLVGGETVQVDKLRDRVLDQLFEAVLSLKSVEECYRFFDDLCTIGELRSLAQRLEVARMLQAGHTYHHIESATGASTATISRVKRCLHYGSDGYLTVLDRIKLPPENREARQPETESATGDKSPSP